MRLWPFSRAPRVQPPAPHVEDFVVMEDVLRMNVEDIFSVQERQVRGAVVIFGGALLMAPARALKLLESRFKPFGYTPFLRAEGGKVWIHALPLAAVTEAGNPMVNVLLFLATCLSTFLVGGISYTVGLLAILVTHEFGHYFTARYYGAAVSLPYFIPAPPPLFFGTLGAIIKMRSPARDRNSLFDIAAAGPLAGLVVAVPVLLAGLSWSRVVTIPPDFGGLVFGDSLLMRFLVYLTFGSIAEGTDVLIHPMGMAGWLGFFVTALNLFPVGQLDGGRIAYALFGRHHRRVSQAAFFSLLALGAITRSLNWFVWAALLLFLIGFDHSPPLDDLTPLSPGRRVVGAFCLLLLVLLVPPIPIQVH